MIAFISGHLDLTKEEFEEHYVPKILDALNRDDKFVVGDARGADLMAQKYLYDMMDCIGYVTVYHMFEKPRNLVENFFTKGGYKSDDERDSAMTKESDYDIAWVRLGREKSGTAKNIQRRNK
jgi:hypothetical protein